MNNVSLSLSGIPLNCNVQTTGTISFLKDFIYQTSSPKAVVSIPEKLKTAFLNNNSSTALTAADEYHLLHLVISNALLPFNRCVFHGTAFFWHDKAWLFSAPSGTGKTTQYRQWRRLYHNEVKIINGDKPILQFCDDGTIMVHPSPWKGKERMGSMLKAPLGGIIYLQQGKENTIERMDSLDAAEPIYRQFLFLPETEEAVHRVCRMEDKLLRNIPVWKLVNKGDAQSAELTHHTLTKWLEENPCTK